MSDYHRPKPRKSLICWYVAWNADGTIRDARYRKPDRGDVTQSESSPLARRPIARGIVEAVEPQAQLL